MPAQLFFTRLGTVAGLFSLLISTSVTFANPAVTVAITVNTYFDDAYSIPNGTCSLREAVRAANLDIPVDACAAGNGADTIIIPAGYYTLRIDGPGEDAALTGDLDITEDLTLLGQGSERTVIETYKLGDDSEYEYNDRNLHILSPASVQVSQLTLRWGSLTAAETGAPQPRGGSILNEGSLNLDQVILRQNIAGGATGLGGAIYNAGSLIVNASRFEGNYAATSGGAIFNAGDVQINGTLFTGNNSGGGDVYGAVNPAGAVDNAPGADARIENSRFVENGNYSGGPVDDVPVVNAGEMRIVTSEFWRNFGRIAGALVNEGVLRIEDSLFQANDGNNVYDGGGAAALWQEAGSLTVLRTTFSYNQSGTGGGGAVVINDAENVLIDESLFQRNSAYHDGGVYHVNGPTTIRNSTFRGNSTYNGGAIGADGENLTIIGCTISGNNADESGAIRGGGSVTIINSTISENEATYSVGAIAVRSLTLISSTVTGNKASGGIGGISVIGEDATVTIQSSIIANNTDQGEEDPDDCNFGSASMTSLGNNLVGTATGCGWIPAAGDMLGTDTARVNPMLDILADNGGPTRTHALLPGSPSIDAGGEDCPATDQRGVPRPQGSACDIGAFEYEQQAVQEKNLYLPVVSR